ncbi:hypothetical protein GKQ23_04875 [Erwinia sp. E602]|uniref:hypothetical protein n=1 Tax=Erwinia sp. E602 TaxID=2675378 RepID=UPI001BAB990E|nr:hypothetical protein [Erwinia sp. E602]QUG74375.1 hypothetical protein GKQ23_04875 [Erwinia sp. E602]
MLPRLSPLSTLLPLLACALSAPTAAAQAIDIQDERVLLSPPEISVRNGTLYYDGKIISGSAEKVINQLKMRRVEKISLNSIGGDVVEAMKLGREIHKRGVDVEVRNVCASACASYLFPAGKNKYIGQNSYLLWHGSLHSPASEIAMENSEDGMTAQKFVTQPEFIALAQQESQFYQTIGVSEKIAYCPQLLADYRQKFPEKWFSWSQAELARFGVKSVYWTTSAVRWQREMSARGVIFAGACG